jgi:hypothetical protein
VDNLRNKYPLKDSFGLRGLIAHQTESLVNSTSALEIKSESYDPILWIDIIPFLLAE